MSRPKGSGNKSELVQLAMLGIDSQISQLQSQIEALIEKRKQLGKSGASGPTVSVSAPVKESKVVATNDGGRKKRHVSAATRKKLQEAATARWARKRGEAA